MEPEPGQRDHQEARRVDEHRRPGAAEPGQQAAQQRPEGGAPVARRLDEPVELGEPGRLAADHGHERELGRLRDGEADPQERREHEDRAGRVERERK
jgi:hypothetical protein